MPVEGELAGYGTASGEIVARPLLSSGPLTVVAIAGAIVAVYHPLFLTPQAALIQARHIQNENLPPPTESTTSDAALRREAWQRIQPRLDWADDQCRRLIPEQIALVDSVFDNACAHTPAFSDKLLGWGSKWRLVADHLPFTRTDRHAIFIRRAFHDYLFTPEQLTQALEQSVRGFMGGIDGVENELLVQIRADLADMPASALPAVQGEDELRSAFSQALQDTTNGVRGDLRADVARETASIVVGEVLTLVVVRLGVSAGILTAGAGSSWATFGVGLIAGLIVDQIVGWVWNWWADPVGELAQQMNDKLRQIERLIVMGDGQSHGLRERLRTMAEERSAVRRRALEQLLCTGE